MNPLACVAVVVLATVALVALRSRNRKSTLVPVAMQVPATDSNSTSESADCGGRREDDVLTRWERELDERAVQLAAWVPSTEPERTTKQQMVQRLASHRRELADIRAHKANVRALEALRNFRGSVFNFDNEPALQHIREEADRLVRVLRDRG